MQAPTPDGATAAASPCSASTGSETCGQTVRQWDARAGSLLRRAAVKARVSEPGWASDYGVVALAVTWRARLWSECHSHAAISSTDWR